MHSSQTWPTLNRTFIIDWTSCQSGAPTSYFIFTELGIPDFLLYQ
jgi:hypothetical protein